MKLPSLYLQAFYACAQAASFTKAAKALSITQSALSQRILNLEEEIASTLFIRERTGLRLTDEGEKLLRYCQSLSELESEFFEQLDEQKNAELSGNIRIASFSSILRSAVLPSLSSILHKNTNLRLQLLSRELYELPSILQNGEVDFILTDSPPNRPGIECIQVGEERNVLVAHKEYHGEEIYLDHDEADSTTELYFKAQAKQKQYRRRFLDDVYGIIDGVEMKLGKSVLPVHLVKDNKNLKIINPRSYLNVPIHLCYYKRSYYSKLHQKIIEHLKQNIQNYL